MADLQTVSVSDSWNTGRGKFNSNEVALNNDIIAANTALANHKSSTDHDGRYYTKAEVDTLTTRPTVDHIITAPIFQSASGYRSAFIPLPVGTITKVTITSSSMNKKSSVSPQAVSAADTMFRIDGQGNNLYMASINGATYTDITITGIPELVTIHMTT